MTPALPAMQVVVLIVLRPHCRTLSARVRCASAVQCWHVRDRLYSRPMPKDVTFLRLTEDPECPECRCVDKRAVVDCNKAFVRRTSDKQPSESDFLSYWESGKRPGRKSTHTRYCEDVCRHKGVSVRLYTTHEELVQHYRTTLSFKRKTTPYYCIVKLTPAAGKVSYTPSNADQMHHDILKADQFTIGDLTLVTTGEISECGDASESGQCLH